MTLCGPGMAPLGNVFTDQPLGIVRGTGGFSLLFSLVDGVQPVLPTDVTSPATDLSAVGTYLLFLVKLYDYDPLTGVPVPDNKALLTKDSRIAGQIIIRTPARNGMVEVPIVSSDTTGVDTYGNPIMPSGATLRWSLKAFTTIGGVAGQQIPLAGPWTVYDRTVQGVGA